MRACNAGVQCERENNFQTAARKEREEATFALSVVSLRSNKALAGGVTGRL